MYTRSLTRPADPPSNKSAGRGPQTSVTLVPRDPKPRKRGFGPVNSDRGAARE
jgi:hypothetical protein